MKFYPNPTDAATTIISSEVPEHLKAKVIAGSKVICMHSDAFGTALSQEITEDLFTIGVHEFFLTRDTQFIIGREDPLITLKFMLRGHADYVLHGFGLGKHTAGYYYLMHLAGSHEEQVFFKAGSHACLHVNLSTNFLTQLAAEHSSLQSLLYNINHEQDKGGQQTALRISRNMEKILQGILHNEHLGVKRNLFLCEQLLQLLRLYIKDLTVYEKKQEEKAARMQQIRDYLFSHLDRQITVSQIARNFMMTESSLKQQFRQYYKTGIQKFALDMRMERAMVLLKEQATSVSEIATALGYGDLSSFTRAFTRYYGNPPAYYRR